MSKNVGEKCGKLWLTKTRTDTLTDERTDGHHHTIIGPVWRPAYKNLKKLDQETNSADALLSSYTEGMRTLNFVKMV